MRDAQRAVPSPFTLSLSKRLANRRVAPSMQDPSTSLYGLSYAIATTLAVSVDRVKAGRRPPEGLGLDAGGRRPDALPLGVLARSFGPARLTAEGDSLPSRWREGRGDGWLSHMLVSFERPPARHAGILNASPLASTAQAMRAFLAAMATTAFQ